MNLLAAAAALLLISEPAPLPQTSVGPNPKLSRDIRGCEPKVVPEAVCRRGADFDLSQARAKLGDAPFTYWIEGDVLRIAARSDSPALRVNGTFQEGLFPLGTDGAATVWGTSYELPHLDQSLLEISIKPLPVGAKPLVYRGGQARRDPKSSRHLRGSFATFSVPSSSLGKPREISVYIPAAKPPPGGYPTVFMTDGRDAEPFARILDALISDHRIQPIMLVGIWAGEDPNDKSPWGLRGREYLAGMDASAYAAHEKFFVDDVLPYARDALGASNSASKRMLLGYSNGADWVLAMATTHPEVADYVAAFSIPGLSNLDFSRTPTLKIYADAGIYEAPFLRSARETCVSASAAGVSCTLTTSYSGHTAAAWRGKFEDVVLSIFGGDLK